MIEYFCDVCEDQVDRESINEMNYLWSKEVENVVPIILCEAHAIKLKETLDKWKQEKKSK